MNTNLLQKCVDELNKETPDISYLKGVLETLIEIEKSNSEKPNSFIPSYPNYFPNGTGTPLPLSPIVTSKTNEDEILEKYENGSIGTIK